MRCSRRRRLRALYARLRGQLDQKVGREKRILRTYLEALGRRLGKESEKPTKEDQPHA